MAPAIDAITSYLSQGGFVMPPLVLAAMLLWYALGYRILSLRRGPRGDVQHLVARHRADGRRHKGAGVLDIAIDRALRLLRTRPQDPRKVLDDAFLELEQDLNKYAVIIRAIVAVAPLTGLLGTVSGMIETFDALGDMSLFSQSGGIAGGISQALISTQMGLSVAIPGLLVGRILDRRQRKLVTELDRLKNLLCAEAAA